MKTGVIFEGGGMRGLYGAGVMDKWMNAKIDFDVVMGVSAVALFGINYVSRQWGRSLRYNLAYAGDKRYTGLYSLLTTGNIMNEEFCFHTLVDELDPFDYETFRKSPTEFYAVVTNCETGKAEYPRLRDMKKDMEWLRATGSLPMVSRFVEIDGKKYLDGGIADSIPLQKMRELGCDRIVLVLTRPLDYRKKKSKFLPMRLMYRNYPRLVEAMENRYQAYNDCLDEIMKAEKAGEIFVIRPSRTVSIGRLETDKTKLLRMYRLGVYDARNTLGALREYLK